MSEGMNFKSGSPHPHPPLMPSWNGLEGYHVIRYLKLFQSTNHLLVFTCLFLICYIFVWIGHWGQEFLLNSSLEIITVIFTVANSLYVIRVIWGIIFLRILYSDETTYQLLLKGHENDFQLQKIINLFFVMNMLILLSLRFGECVCYYEEIAIWIFYFPMTIFHDFINAFALTISLFLIISQQGLLQLLLSQLRFNLSSIFYDGKSFVSQEFLLQSPYPSPVHSHRTSQSLFLLSTPSSSLPSPLVQVNPVIDSQSLPFHRQISKEENGDIEINENESRHAHTSSNSLSEYDIFLLFTQHYLHLHSSFHYLTVTYGKYLLFLIASMLCTILHLILYIYAYRSGSSLSSIIESICSFYVIVVLMFNLAKVNVLGRHVQTLITRKCIHLLTTLQSNPFLTTAPQLSPTSSRISPDIGTVTPHSNPHISSPATDRMIFYHQINGFISSLQILKLTFGFTRYFALDYNGLNALLFSLVLSMIPRLLTNHMHQ